MRRKPPSREEAAPKRRAKSVAGPPMTLANMRKYLSRELLEGPPPVPHPSMRRPPSPNQRVTLAVCCGKSSSPKIKINEPRRVVWGDERAGASSSRLAAGGWGTGCCKSLGYVKRVMERR